MHGTLKNKKQKPRIIKSRLDLFEQYRNDPVFFAEHFLGIYTWSKMRDVMRSVRDNKRTAIRAGHGLSKTFTAALVAVWFYNLFPKSKVITTAPTYPQVDKLLWSEIRNLYMRVPGLRGECLKTEIKDGDNPQHFAYGFSTDKPARAEGFHAPEILFIFDEAKGIAQWMWDSVKGAMNAGHARWLVLSTTDGVKVGEQFHKIFRGAPDWHTIAISAEDSPTTTGELFLGTDQQTLERREKTADEVGAQISGTEYIEQSKKDWGEDSVLYKTKVRGDIVDEGANTVVKLSTLSAAYTRKPNDDGRIEFGVDVARYGEDRTVFFKRKGLRVLEYRIYTKQSITDTAAAVMEFVGNDVTAPIKIDDGGLGGGVTDILTDANYNAVPVNFGQKAKDPDKYTNAISEAWFETAEAIKTASIDPDARHDDLETELVNRQWIIDKKGRRVIESKDDYKKRGFRSPDFADAFVLCFYEIGEEHFFTRGIM